MIESRSETRGGTTGDGDVRVVIRDDFVTVACVGRGRVTVPVTDRRGSGDFESV